MRALLALLVVVSVAHATPMVQQPPARGFRQGDPCTSDADCHSPSGRLQCKTTSGKPRCELTCDAKTKCPDDQRCVKDNKVSVCRPINDGPDL